VEAVGAMVEVEVEVEVEEVADGGSRGAPT
jgi:hypothetical protein